MPEMEVRGRMIDVYKLLRDLSWSYPNMTLYEFIQLHRRKTVFDEVAALQEIVDREKRKRDGE